MPRSPHWSTALLLMACGGASPATAPTVSSAALAAADVSRVVGTPCAEGVVHKTRTTRPWTSGRGRAPTRRWSERSTTAPKSRSAHPGPVDEARRAPCRLGLGPEHRAHLRV